MVEINRITPTYPVMKPTDVMSEENRQEKKGQQKKKKQQTLPDAEQQNDNEPVQHIDEIV